MLFKYLKNKKIALFILYNKYYLNKIYMLISFIFEIKEKNSARRFFVKIVAETAFFRFAGTDKLSKTCFRAFNN